MMEKWQTMLRKAIAERLAYFQTLTPMLLEHSYVIGHDPWSMAGFEHMESQGQKVAFIYMNPADWPVFRFRYRDALDIEPMEWKRKCGGQADVWGAHVVTSKLVPQGDVWHTTNSTDSPLVVTRALATEEPA